MAPQWSPESWRSKPIKQVPDYPDARALPRSRSSSRPFRRWSSPARRATSRPSWPASPPARLFCCRAAIAPRASPSTTPTTSAISSACLLQMAVVLTYRRRPPVVKVGRMAGQFAKPRSSPTETQNGKELPSYRGDIVNGIEFTDGGAHARSAAADEAYRQSAATLNLLRAFAHGGYANLDHVHQWNARLRQGQPGRASLSGGRRPDRRERCDFMRACGLDPGTDAASCARPSFYTSHEALLLGYEQAHDPRRIRPRAMVRDSATCSGSATAPANSIRRTSSSARHQEPDRRSNAGPSLRGRRAACA